MVEKLRFFPISSGSELDPDPKLKIGLDLDPDMSQKSWIEKRCETIGWMNIECMLYLVEGLNLNFGNSLN